MWVAQGHTCQLGGYAPHRGSGSFKLDVLSSSIGKQLFEFGHVCPSAPRGPEQGPARSCPILPHPQAAEGRGAKPSDSSGPHMGAQ